MKIFLAIPLNAPAAALTQEMQKRGLVAIVCRSRNLAEHKKLILTSDLLGHWAHNVDELVRRQIDFARANSVEVVTIEYLLRTLKP